MSKIIKNLTDSEKVYGGFTIFAGETHTVDSSQETSFQKSKQLLSDLLSEPPQASIKKDEGTEISGPDAIDILMSKDITIGDMPFSYPFAKKELPGGKKLKRRKRGLRMSCPGNTDTPIIMVVPYVHCKIDEVEIINCSGNDDVDLQVLDSDVGTYTGVPNALLDQFGFNVACSDLYYSDSSNYDADLHLGMQVQIVFKNKEVDTKNIGVNFVLHEVV